MSRSSGVENRIHALAAPAMVATAKAHTAILENRCVTSARPGPTREATTHRTPRPPAQTATAATCNHHEVTAKSWLAAPAAWPVTETGENAATASSMAQAAEPGPAMTAATGATIAARSVATPRYRPMSICVTNWTSSAPYPGPPILVPSAAAWVSSRCVSCARAHTTAARTRSEEHTSELQSRGHLVCRLLLEKKKEAHRHDTITHNTP